MLEMIEANWPLIVAALVIGLLIAWFVFHFSRKTSVTSSKEDVLDEGASPAARNQALIDSAPSAAPAPVVPPAPQSAADARETTAAAGAPQQAPKAEAEPPISATEPPAAAPTGSSEAGDDLTRIKGVGPKLAALLRDMGVTSFADIANWDASEIARIDAKLGRFQGRIERDSWVEQAKFLAAGDRAGYEGKFGNLD